MSRRSTATMTLDQRYENASEQAYLHGQDHIFAYWDDLTTKQKERLLDQAEAIDYQFIKDTFNKDAQQQPPTEGITPPKTIEKGNVSERIRQKGRDPLQQGRIAVLIVAGGQGSRLGFDGPKGCYPCTPLTKKSIFQLLAEKVKAAGQRYGATPELYIMTSETNHDDTVAFFKEHDHFGLDQDKVVFFQQRMLPAVDENGHVLLKGKGEIATAPCGTGGTYAALADAGLLDRMERKGITMVNYLQVDNPLAPVADEAFIGQHLLEGAEISTKAVEKTYPEEKVGLLVEKDGKTRMLEYIFLSKKMAERRDEDGKLAYRAGNIAIHLINTSFIRRVNQEADLPHFLAHKKVDHLDRDGTPVNPEKPNAYKFESFIFDALPLAEHAMTMMVPREEEFAPIKNKDGKDSPDSSKNLQIAQAKRWLEAAGITKEAISRVETVETSPLLATDAQAFAQAIENKKDTIEAHLKKVKKAYLS
mgnify:CR=1 FL=1